MLTERLAALFQIIACHLIGDYVLQSDFLAKTKGNNWYHLFVHSALYVIPFWVCFGFGWGLLILLLTHIAIDALKAKYGVINYAIDQVLHYYIATILLTLGVL